MTDQKTTTYLLIHENKTKRKVTVPSDWKVTFGPLVVGGNRNRGDRQFKIPVALRFYENEKQQRAVFLDVISFRDLSIPVLEEKVEIRDKFGNLEVDGARKNVAVRAEMREWVDPDKEPDKDHSELLEFNLD
jgi:hypothetical protein